MSPMLASILEQMENEPGTLDRHVISSGASMAISHIRRLEALLSEAQDHESKRLRAALEPFAKLACVYHKHWLSHITGADVDRAKRAMDETR